MAVLACAVARGRRGLARAFPLLLLLLRAWGPEWSWLSAAAGGTGCPPRTWPRWRGLSDPWAPALLMTDESSFVEALPPDVLHTRLLSMGADAAWLYQDLTRRGPVGWGALAAVETACKEDDLLRPW